jgi:membrane protease YdiL (CAAX protease family)
MSKATVWRAPDGEIRGTWQILIFVTSVLAAALIVGSIGFGLISVTPIKSWARELRIPLSQVATCGSIMLATWLTARAVGTGDQVWRLAGLDRRAWKARGLALATILGIAVIALPTGLLLLTGQAGITAVADQGRVSTFVLYWAAAALFAPAALAEELLFRGFAFDLAERKLGARSAVALTSVFFAMAHVANPDPSAISIVAVTAAGLFLGALRVVTGGIVAPFLAHFLVNFTQATVFHAPVSGVALPQDGRTLTPFGPAWLTGGTWGPEGGLAVVAAMLVATFLLMQYHNSRHLNSHG